MNKIYKTLYLKALMLVMLTGLFAFSANAQITVSDNPNTGLTQYVGEDSVFIFEATGYDAGTEFVLYYDNEQAFDGADSGSDNYILDRSTTQDADVTFNFEWPTDGTYNMHIYAITGDAYGDQLETVTIENEEYASQIGSYGDGDFYRAGTRRGITDPVDLDITDTATVSLDFFGYNDLDEDSSRVVKLYYSIDGGSTYESIHSSIVSSAKETDTLSFLSGTVYFGLPDAAKTAATIFKVEQAGSDTLEIYERNWYIGDIDIAIGEQYSVVDNVTFSYTVTNPSVTIEAVRNAIDAGVSSAYPGDELTVVTNVSGIEAIGDYNWSAFFWDGTEAYELDGLTETIDNAKDSLRLTGTVPLDIPYQALTLYVYAIDGETVVLSNGYMPNFADDDDFSELVVTSGEVVGSDIYFEETGERKITFPSLDMTSQGDNGVEFSLARLNNELSAASTGVVFEYSLDGGSTFTAIDTILLNDLPVYGGFDTYTLAADDYGSIASTATVFQLRQLTNNGFELDSWALVSFNVTGANNLIGDVNPDDTGFTISRPAITLNALDIDEEPYPMTEMQLTYEITNGEFPSGTGATLLMERSSGTYDIILATIDDVTTASITFNVPPVEAGDYSLYLLVEEEEYHSVSLPVYDLGLSITDITYSDPVSIEGVDHGILGSAMTVNYDLAGTPGTGASLIMSVYDYEENEYVKIGETMTFDGSITATLPTDTSFIDYNGGGNPSVQLSIGTGSVFEDGNIFSDLLVNESLFNDDLEEQDFIQSAVGQQNYIYNNSLSASGSRSVTLEPFDISLGAYYFLRVYSLPRSSDFDILLEVSTDGENWEEYNRVTITADYSYYNLIAEEVPNEYWSETTQFRMRYVDEWASNENAVVFDYVQIFRPELLEAVADNDDFNLAEPSLTVGPIESRYLKGDEVTVTYNALYFPSDIEFALVVEQNDEYRVLGTSGDHGLSSITGTLPIIELDDDGETHEISIYPYRPSVSGGDIEIANSWPVDQGEDFLIVEGDTEEDDFDDFRFTKAGDRILLTRALDLSGASQVYLGFDYQDDIGSSFDLSDNKNVIPRLQASIDGGETFSEVPVYELEEGEEQIYDDGLLYLSDYYFIEIPAEFLTSATHFRWYQPLNLGEGENVWNIEDVELFFENDNRIQNIFFLNNNNNVSTDIDNPDLGNYIWEVADLDDAIFNGESFDYFWGRDDEVADFDLFPSGTQFTFTVDGETDPQTNENLVLGTVSDVGTFSAEAPFYLENGNYDVILSASIDIEIDGEVLTYYFYEDEYVGDFDVFLRVIKTILDYPENEPLYAGSTVTFSVEVENDSTGLAADDLYATLVAENFDDGDLVLATQQGVEPMTVELPPYLRDDYNFITYISENSALGEVGSEINTGSDDLVNLNEDPDNFPSHVFDNEIETPYDEYINSSDSYRLQWDWSAPSSVNYSLYYSVNFGEYILIGNYGGTTGNDYHSSSVYLNAGSYLRYKWVLTSGEELEVFDVRIEDTGNNQEVYFGTNLTPDRFADLDLEFNNDFGRGLIASRPFTSSELSGKTLLSVDITFDELAEDISDDQFLILEYSTDGGTTYSELASFPDVNETEETLDEDTFLFSVSDDMKLNGAEFRFRQEERNDIYVSIDDFSFISENELPFDYESTYRTIADQVLLVNDVLPTSSCLEDDITVVYEVRGKFGAENVVTVSYEDIDGNEGDIDGIEFNIVDGSDSLVVNLPSDLFDEYDNNKWFRFRLNYEDNTSEDLFDGDFTFDSDSEPYGEDLVEVVAPAYQEAEFELIDDVLACDPENAMVDIYDVQNYFSYEIFDTSDGTVLGTLTYDPEDGNTEVDLGAIAANVDLGMRILPASSDGTTTCTTITSTYVEEVEILENYELYLYNDNLGEYEIVSTGQTLTICEDADVELSVRRLFVAGNTSSASNSQVEWFKGDVNTPLSDVTNLDEDDIFETGDYFARVTDGSCSYLTETITITVEESLDQPTTTLVSGSLTGCEGDDPAVLSAPAGFDYYQWSTPFGTVTTQTVEADQEGSYSVRVSNRPFNTPGTCESPYSVNVYVERFNLSEFGISTTSSITAGDVITEGEEISACEDQIIYFFDDTSLSSNGGTIQTMRSTDGGANFSVYGNTTSSSVILEESGTYMFTWINDDAFDNGCSVNSVSFNLTIFEQPDAVVITTTDATDFCEGAGTVTLTAPAGFAQYRWLRNGGAIGSNNNGFGNDSNTIEVRDAGDYAVQVSNEADGTGCFSIQSNEITLNVRTLASDAVSVDPPATLCGPGTASVGFTSTQDRYSYQIFDQNTDTPVGDAFIGSDNGDDIYVDIPLTEQTTFYVMVSYADGEGCPDPEPSTTFTLYLYNVELVLDGNTITAENIGGNGYTNIEWFRNGVRLRNRSGDRDITVTDNAEYSAEVEYGSGDCIITTNTVSIEGARIQTLFGSLEATTYPNPATDFVNVEMKGGDLGRYDVTISNLSGQVMLAETFDKATENEMMKVDVRNIEKGIYTLTVKRGNALQSFRIVKQ